MKVFNSFQSVAILLFVVLIQSCSNDGVPRIPKDFVYAMGANRDGVIGNKTLTDAVDPYKVIGVSDVIQVAAARSVSMALTSDGKVFAWGDNSSGQLGVGDTARISTETRQIKGLPTIQKIATGGRVSLALDKAGDVWMWGTIFVNGFDSETLFSSTFPVKVDLRDIVDIDCGAFYCAAVSSDGDLYTWGCNGTGVLGDGTRENRLIPQKIPDLVKIKKVSAGYYHMLALSEDNQVFAWGFNLHGELAIGVDYSGTGKASPNLISSLENVVDIAAGGNHNLCLLADGTLWGWGMNYYGEVGAGYNGSSQSYYYPVQITSISGIKQIDATGESSIALTDDGKFWAWGNYSFSSVDVGYAGSTRSVPTRIEQLDSAKTISSGEFHYLIVK